MNSEHPTVINAPRRTPVAVLVLSAALLTAWRNQRLLGGSHPVCPHEA